MLSIFKCTLVVQFDLFAMFKRHAVFVFCDTKGVTVNSPAWQRRERHCISLCDTEGVTLLQTVCALTKPGNPVGVRKPNLALSQR